MIQTLIGQKIDQAQTFLENGLRIPVTEVSVSDNVILQVKSTEIDKYTAVQLGVGTKKKPNQALVGHSKRTGLESSPAMIREVAWQGDEEFPKAGDVVTVETIFKPGDIVQVTGTSKGKGFAGTVKRHNFRGGPKTHGQSDRHRAPGAIGQGTTPGRVYKGKRMAGHMGVETVTIKNLVVVDVDSVNKKLYVLGLVPGHKKAMILITRMGEQKNFVRLLSTKRKEDAAAAIEAAKVEKEQAASEAKAAKEAEVSIETEDAKTEEIEAKTEAVTEKPAKTEKEEQVSPSEEGAKKDGK